MNKFLSSRKFMIAMSFLGLFLLSTGSSWALFSFLRGAPSVGTADVSDSRGKIDPSLPKTEECPINGQMFSKPVRDIWETRRPVTAMVENHVDARPLSGMSKADVVYEAVAEGGITRFLGVFYCGASEQDFEVAVIRSARVYYINWAAEYGDKPLFLHWGGANNICNNCPGGVKERGKIDPRVDAFKMLSQLGWRNGTYGNDLDGQSNFGYPALVRVQDRLKKGERTPDEHTPVAKMDLVYEQAAQRGYGFEDEDGVAWDENFVKWRFADGAPLSSPTASQISFEFWSNKADYDVSWKYNSQENNYLRSNGGKPFTDYYFDNAPVVAKNVVIQFVDEEGPVDKELHMFYTTVGEGDILVFQNGGVVKGTWEKKSLTDRTIFYDDKGAEINFVRGPIWIEAVPTGNDIEYN
jgi:hypothetical protein